MTIRIRQSAAKSQLAQLLAEGNIQQAEEYFINASSNVRADAGFIALAHNKPEFLDVIFSHPQLLKALPTASLYKQVLFASCVEHYRVLADAAIPRSVVKDGDFLGDLFDAVVSCDNAIFLNWLLDNDYTPLPNYAANDNDPAHTLLAIACLLNASKCIVVLIERGFIVEKPTQLKDMAWAYPHDEDTLNCTKQWNLLLSDISITEGIDPLVLSEWFDSMIKSSRNAHFALLSMLARACSQDGNFFTLDKLDLVVVASNSKQLNAYLKALSNRTFSSLDSSQVVLSLFFNKPELTETRDFCHACNSLLNASLDIRFTPYLNDRYRSALSCRALASHLEFLSQNRKHCHFEIDE